MTLTELLGREIASISASTRSKNSGWIKFSDGKFFDAGSVKRYGDEIEVWIKMVTKGGETVKSLVRVNEKTRTYTTLRTTATADDIESWSNNGMLVIDRRAHRLDQDWEQKLAAFLDN